MGDLSEEGLPQLMIPLKGSGSIQKLFTAIPCARKDFRRNNIGISMSFGLKLNIRFIFKGTGS